MRGKLGVPHEPRRRLTNGVVVSFGSVCCGVLRSFLRGNLRESTEKLQSCTYDSMILQILDFVENYKFTSSLRATYPI